MAANTTENSKTTQLIRLMTEGDEAFNARDFEALDAVHDPDMIAFVAGSAEPLYGREAHGVAMKHMLAAFPDITVHLPYPVQFGGEDWITVVTTVTGTFTGEMALPDGTAIPPTGKSFDLEFAQTTKWRDDRLVLISAFWDTALQARQMGLG